MQLRPPTAPATQQVPAFQPPAKRAAQKLPEWARVLFEDQWNFISLRGGRGSAKTESVARALVMRSTVQPLRVLCTREVQLSIKESVYSVLCKVIRSMGLSSQFEILSNEIRSKLGGSFIFRGLADESIDSLKSLDDIDICWVEEAQSVSKKSLELLYPSIRGKGIAGHAQIWFTWNPQLESDPIYQDVVVEGLPNCASLWVNFDQNPWFDESGLRVQEQHMLAKDPVRHKHVWLGHPLPAVEGAIYYEDIVKMVEEDRIRNLRIDPLLQMYLVFDLGFNDAMVCWVVQRTTQDIRVVDYVENNKVSLAWFDTELRGRGYETGIICLPHDGKHKNLQTALSPEEIMQMYGWQTEIVDNVGVETGIRLTREQFPIMYIDKTRCAEGLEHLKRYARNKHGHPVHDEHSHAADGLRYVGVHANMMSTVLKVGGSFANGWGGQLNYPQICTA